MVLRPKTATGGESPVYLAQDLYVGDMYDQQWLQTRKMVETQGLPGSMAVDFQIELMGFEASSAEWDGAKEAGGDSTEGFSLFPFQDPGWEKRVMTQKEPQIELPGSSFWWK